MTSKKTSTAALEASRKAVIAAARKAGVPLADINRAIGVPRLAPKKRPKAWKAGASPTIDQVVDVFLTALAKHGEPVALADLQSPRTLRVWSGPRAVAMWVVREVLKDAVTLKTIGEFFGRDHSTVVAALNRCKHGVFDRGAMAKSAKATIAHFRKAA